MKRFATFTVLVLLTMLLLAGTAAAQQTGATGGWANSNRSGEVGVIWDGGPLLRNVPGQLTHTAFQLNTNSCASCHMTHTAVGTNLLIQATTQDTCMACHDGTIGFLNVEAPAAVGSAAINAGMGGSVAAGTFNVLPGRTPSMHDTTTNQTISAAPGGLRTGTERGAWTARFTCASCHAPHGSHSIRLLHFNPNNVAVRAVANAVYTTFNTVGYGVAGGGYRPSVANNIYLNDVTTVTDAAYINPGNPTGTIHTYNLTGAPAAPWVAGYSTSHTLAAIGTVAGGRTNQFWTRIYSNLWNPTVVDSTYADPTVDITAANHLNLLTRHFTINFATGTITQTPAQRATLIARLRLAPFNFTSDAAAETAGLRIDVATGIRVRARAAAEFLPGGAVDDLVLGAREVNFIDPASYDALAYNLFCAACHTDYLPTVRASDQLGAGVGRYSQKLRHTINRGASTANTPMPVRGSNTWVAAQPNLTGAVGTGTNQLMCLSCHFAHGADASMMLLADNTRVSNPAGVAGTPTDPGQNDVSATLGGSSALKRYINQASCWHCHVRSSATPFMNTTYYWNQMPHGPTW